MPIYEYRCENGHTFEVLQSMSDDPVETCEECGAPVQRVYHPVAVHYKGSGFYTTDYAGKGKGKGGGESGSKSDADSKSDSGSGDSGSSDSSKSDSSTSSDSGSSDKKTTSASSSD
jgi:putative FmdB family regulatory protein